MGRRDSSNVYKFILLVGGFSALQSFEVQRFGEWGSGLHGNRGFRV